jgi:hypothetical protein
LFLQPLFLLALALPLATHAQQPAAPDAAPGPANVWLPRQSADLLALDKVTARATPLTVPVGHSASFGALTIAVQACVVRPPDQPADAAAFLAITDSHPGAAQFRGWVVLSAPAVGLLESPVYGVRLAACR